MSTPGNINLNVNPYYDDYDEDKNFVRVLYRPGRAVQARELTQAQTYQQKQFERFANFIFDEGAIVEGCEISPNLKQDYVKLQSTYFGNTINVENFVGQKVIGANTGIIAEVNLATDLEGDDPKTLFISYTGGGGALLSCNNNSQLVVGNEIQFSFPVDTTNTATITSVWNDPYTGEPYFVITGSGDFPTEVPNTVTGTSTDTNGSPFTILLNTGFDKRTSTRFEDSEILICVTDTGTFYANTATLDATQYVVNADTDAEVTYTKGSALTIGAGTVYIGNHFVNHDSQSIILDKYSNTPSYKVGLVPNVEFIDSIDDATLVDNAQGSPNFQAPGADRLKITTTLTKYDLNDDVVLDSFVSYVEIDEGIIRKRRTIEIGGQIEDAIAQRTYDESGDYTLNDPIIAAREHLINGDNRGRYSLEEGGDNELLIINVDPMTAYVKGYRHETVGKAEVPVRKGIDTQYVEQVKTQLAFGGGVNVKEVIGSWDINQGTRVDIYNTAQAAISNTSFASTTVSGSKIGTARIKSLEYVSGTPGTSSGIFNFYLYDVVMNSGNLFESARSFYLAGSPAKFADIVLDSLGRAVLSDTTFDKLIFKLPYNATKTIRDPSNNIETSFYFKSESTITLTAGVASVSSTDALETFEGTGALTSNQKNDNYLLIPTATANTAALTGTVAISASSNVVVGTSTSFSTNFNVGDVIRVNGLDRIVNSIANATYMTLTTTHTGATANTYSKSFPAGKAISLTGYGSTGASRSVTVSTPTSVTIDIAENVTLTGAKLISSMARANAREKSKLLSYGDTVYIQANTHPKALTGPWSLGKGDVITVRGIYQANDFVSIPTTANTNVTEYYTFDNGQTDNTYEHATLSPINGTVPTGRLLVVFDSYNHNTTQGTGYFSIDSYPINDSVDSNTTITTSEVPVYTSKKTGQTYNLRDCLDFRPIKTASVATLNPTDPGTYQIPTTGSVGLHIPTPDSDFDADLIYYKGRKSRLYLTQEGEFKVNDGPALDQDSIAPAPIAGTLQLAELTIPPYPTPMSEVGISPVKNRRYTMRDVGSIEQRVSKLEAYNLMNTAEKEVVNTVIIDPVTGVDKFKNGLLVDVFTGHNIADVNSSLYKASIDRHNNYVTAYANNEMQVQLAYNTSGSTGVVKTPGNKLMLAYTEIVSTANQSLITSNTALTTVPINYVGDLSLFPSTDNWINTTRVPGKDLANDPTGQLDNWRVRADAWNTETNPAVRYFIGDDPSLRSLQAAGVVSSSVPSSTISGLNSAILTQQQTNPATGRILDTSVQHTMRSRDIIITASALKNSTRLYFFFDGMDVTANVTPISIASGSTISTIYELFDANGFLPTTSTQFTRQIPAASGITSANGKFTGIFRVPANKFNVGAREFKISDKAVYGDSAETSYAKCTFYTQGSSVTSTSSILDTRPTNRLSNKSLISALEKEVESGTNTRILDPLIQTFIVDPSTYVKGMMVTSVDLFFSSRPATTSADGVTVDIREVDSITGAPTRNIIGNQVARVERAQIQVAASPTSTIATKFTFPSPIYLQPGKKYAIAVKADGNNKDYKLWIAESGKKDISSSTISNRYVALTSQTELWTPSTGGNWTKSTSKDLKFAVNIARFYDPKSATSKTGGAILNNMPISSAIVYNGIYPNIEDLSLPSTRIEYQMSQSGSSFVSSNYSPIKNLELIKNTVAYQISNTAIETSRAFKSLRINATLTTENPYISPYIDLQRVNCALTRNIINNSTFATATGTVEYTASSNVVTGYGTSFTTELAGVKYIKTSTNEYRQIASVSNNTSLVVANNFNTTSNGVSLYYNTEDNPVGPHTALSRYITRVVTLNDGFDSSDLIVYLDVNRPKNTDIKVYYKVLNSADQDSFDNKFWTEMSLEGLKTFTSSPDAYSLQKYVVSNLGKKAALLSGTANTTASSAIVVGTNTAFLEQLKIGDTVGFGVNRTEGIVGSISNNTYLTLTSVSAATANTQDIYRLMEDTIEYTTADGITYNGFKSFAIKIVFLSSNSAFIPKVKSLKAVALD